MTPSLERISDYPRHHAAQIPDRLALIHDQERLTYSALADAVDTTAEALLARGVQPGDRVATMATPRPDAIISYLATASIGGIWLGLNPGYTARELAYVLSDARPVLITHSLPDILDTSLAALRDAADEVGLPEPVAVSSLRASSPLTDTTAPTQADITHARDRVRGPDPALIVYTSGSTGQPKGALIRHSGLVRLGIVQSGIWQVDDLVTLCNLPINHIGCVGDLIGVPLVAGGTILLRDRFDAHQVVSDIEEHRITALFQIPTQLQRIAALPEFERADLSRLAVVGWGGSPLPVDTIHRYRERGCQLIATYGLTEATSSVTYTDPDATDEVLLNTVGRPDPGMNVRLLANDGSWVTGNGEGEVCIRNETTMAGYLNRPEATADAYTPDGWLRTGDIGRLRPDGNLVLVGRAHEMFKSGGYNVYPREIEHVIESHPAVAIAAVVPAPHADFHEVGAAYIQLVGDLDFEVDELRSYCRERLAGYKVPKTFTILPDLPLLPVGKIDKPALRRQAADSAAATKGGQR